MNEVEMMFSFDIIEDVLSGGICSFEQRVESYFVVIEFASIDD
jgi:hypothetical protein